MDVTLTPDEIIYFQYGPIKLTATLVFSWLVMALLVLVSWLITRNLSTGPGISRWQSLLETLVLTIRSQIAEIAQGTPDRYLPFIGTLFLFISVANLLAVVPGYRAPMASLSATSALAICVFFAVPFFAIRERGVRGYLRYYIEPSPIILPFRIISDFSRTIALAIRLFGNVMSGGLILAILISIVPLVVPVVLSAFELLIGQIQAYIFAILAMVYIGAAAQVEEERVSERSAVREAIGGSERDARRGDGRESE
ncbi:MAG TPA: F0F1 ATP synthase subunit A [Candidatus Sulfomarinibacteraceae bacterium]|nr:F0F1 ATP synthase subunit A [Candidatus Sulfomarinibacteraceae bacterium]